MTCPDPTAVVVNSFALIGFIFVFVGGALGVYIHIQYYWSKYRGETDE